MRAPFRILAVFGLLAAALTPSLDASAQQAARVTSNPTSRTLTEGALELPVIDQYGRAWIANPGAGGAGGGGDASATNQQLEIAALGSPSDTAWTGSGTSTIIAALKAQYGLTSARLPASLGQKAAAGSLSVVLASDQGAVPVSGTFWQSVQPISASTLPLPTGAASSANQASELAALGTTADTAYAGSGTASIIAALKGNYNALLAPTPAGTNTIGKVGIDQSTPGTTNGVANYGYDGTTWRQLLTTTTGALAPPTAASGKITPTMVSLSANTSTQLVAANDQRIAIEIQCDGTAPVGVSRTGATLTSATNAPLVLPSGSYPLYTMPIASLTAITAYTGTTQTCRVTEYLR